MYVHRNGYSRVFTLLIMIKMQYPVKGGLDLYKSALIRNRDVRYTYKANDLDHSAKGPFLNHSVKK